MRISPAGLLIAAMAMTGFGSTAWADDPHHPAGSSTPPAATTMPPAGAPAMCPMMAGAPQDAGHTPSAPPAAGGAPESGATATPPPANPPQMHCMEGMGGMHGTQTVPPASSAPDDHQAHH